MLDIERNNFEEYLLKITLRYYYDILGDDFVFEIPEEIETTEESVNTIASDDIVASIRLCSDPTIGVGSSSRNR